MAVGEIRRLRHLNVEHRKLKQLVADLTLDKVILQEVLAKRPEAHAQYALVPMITGSSRSACGRGAPPVESSLMV